MENHNSNSNKKIVNAKYYKANADQLNEKRRSSYEEQKKIDKILKTHGLITGDQLLDHLKQKPQTDQQATTPTQTTPTQTTPTQTEPTQTEPTQTEPTNDNEISIHPINVNKNIMTLEKKYFERDNEFFDIDLLQTLEEPKGLCLVGRSGTGKTEMAKAYAQKNNLPCVIVKCSSAMRDHQLLGSFQLVNGNSVYVCGKILEAVEIANKHPAKKCVLVFDELNTLTNDVQKILNENLNFRSGIDVPLINKVYQLNEDSNIICLATMNPSGSYLGTNELNRELVSRFLFKNWNDWSTKELKQLMSVWKIDETYADCLIELYSWINSAKESEEDLCFDMDARELIEVCEIFIQCQNKKMSKVDSMAKGLKLAIVDRYYSNDQSHAKLVIEQIESIFPSEEPTPKTTTTKTKTTTRKTIH